ncbi:O-phosphoseryl-tRNA(Sec) selenium transferase [Methanococcus aeolicus]|uniref:O-phosphoseryl-tRNA(Sec) selenium transferase n=1 Tax=Methanococcus aeolicus TaxID=42879 RepID=UPI0021C86C4F|nr:O-phosphoseryl-tRNA(Sec) selenium transferase [Methanococcus aeolicus]UXM85251.1 O-phosphoseryl-tRNA(Sec) selenium transferase [Methanococcus aeolicus]
MIDLNISGIIPKNMENRGKLVLNDNLKNIEDIFNHRVIPKQAMSDEEIELFLKLLSLMDTDKDPKSIRIGEREARTSSNIHNRLVSGFCHGVGRSGNLIDPQPKAPGASVMYSLTNSILTSFLKKLGLNVSAIATPIATGMSISLCLSALRKKYGCNTVIYPYAAHKSPIKAVSFSGLKMRLVETVLSEDGESVYVPVEDIENAIKKEINKNDKYGDSNIYTTKYNINNKKEIPCVLSTLTFFPPRKSDDIVEIAKICEEYNIPHIINGAYAIQNQYYIDRLKKAFKYRVDAVISSSDKNLLTPIGGGIIYSKDKEFINEISKTYPGRACATPIVNTLVSLLSIGLNNYKELMKQQKESRKLLHDLLVELANNTNNKVLNIDSPLSICITTNSDPVEIAGKLYNLRITGPRGVRSSDKFGNCYLGNFPYDYVVMNAAIGIKNKDIINAVDKLKYSMAKNKNIMSGEKNGNNYCNSIR